MVSHRISPAPSLPVRLAESLRERVAENEWPPGSRLPSEAELAEEYQVSRGTVRAALKFLEARGLVEIRHGSGTYASRHSNGIQTGLQELRSLTETIRDQGHVPDMHYRTIEIRPATEDEAKNLDILPGSPILSLKRSVLSDGVVIAYSYDVIPTAFLPADFEPRTLKGSTFAMLEQAGVRAVWADAAIEAARSSEIGWEPEPPESELYLLLKQVHFQQGDEPVMYSKTYFVQGRSKFGIRRTR